MDNSVLNSSDPKYRKVKPGLYQILCLKNDYRYYGESSNVSGRLASHKSMLRRNIHKNQTLQNDWNLYGEENFEFILLDVNDEKDDWSKRQNRLAEESSLIALHSEKCYNVFESWEKRRGELNPFYQKRHSEEGKKRMREAKKDISNDKLGMKIEIEGVIYPSQSEAARLLKHSRRYIRKRLKSSKPEDSEWTIIDDPANKKTARAENIGSPKRVKIEGNVYPSIANASKKLGRSREYIRLRTNSNEPDDTNWEWVKE